jgi:hypothetical protein
VTRRGPRTRIDELCSWPIVTRSQLFHAVFWAGSVEARIAAQRGFLDPRTDPHIVHVPRLPTDPDQRLALENILVEGGTAPWMPGTWTDRPWITMTTRGASVTPPGLRDRAALEPRLLRVTEATRVANAGAEHAPGARWRLRVDGVDGDGNEIDIRLAGRWVSLCWLGYLGGWTDPSRNELPPVSAEPLNSDWRPGSFGSRFYGG